GTLRTDSMGASGSFFLSAAFTWSASCAAAGRPRKVAMPRAARKADVLMGSGPATWKLSLSHCAASQDGLDPGLRLHEPHAEVAQRPTRAVGGGEQAVEPVGHELHCGDVLRAVAGIAAKHAPVARALERGAARQHLGEHARGLE